jgi:hypothetical protein
MTEARPQARPPRNQKKKKSSWPLWAAISAVLTLFAVLPVLSVIEKNRSLNPVASTTTSSSTSPSAASATPQVADSATTEGPVGTSFTLTSDDGTSYDVTLIKIVDPARGADEFSTPSDSSRFVGAVFSITGRAGHSSDNANNDALLVGSDGQDYQSDFSQIKGYTNFNGGDWNVGVGKTVTGAVTFQVPKGVTVQSIQWGGLFASTPASWNT